MKLKILFLLNCESPKYIAKLSPQIYSSLRVANSTKISEYDQETKRKMPKNCMVQLPDVVYIRRFIEDRQCCHLSPVTYRSP